MPAPKSVPEYGEMYAGALVTPPPKGKRKKENWYIRFCRRAGKMFKAPDKFKKEDYKIAIDFLGWDLKPKEVNAAPTLALLIGLMVAMPLLVYVFYSVFVAWTLPFIAVIYIAPVLILLPFLLTMQIQNYPMKAAEAQKMRSVTEISEIINYLVMSMKLTPNLEKAIEFASEHGHGRIAEDLKALVWDVQVGTYRTAEEGLDVLAYKWGHYSDEFKHSLMLIRSSVIEVDEAKRHVILDKAVTDVLEGIKDDMDKYAAQMRQPSVYLYYVGVLLPLMLIIMLPIGSMMAKLPLAQAWVLVLLYNILIPIGTVYFANTILKKRPPLCIPPVIPDDYPGLPKKNHVRIGKTMVPAVIVAIGAAILIYLSFSMFLDPLLNPVPPSWDEAALADYVPFFTVAGAVIGIATAVCIYLYGSAYAKRKVQKELMAMETEFQDSIYVIASRLGENRPMEEAMAYTADFLEGTATSKLFRRAVDNIRNLGMTVEMALFDPLYGALKDVPSDIIRSSMRIVVDSIGLGVQQAARALISLSLQLRDSQKVKQRIYDMLSEITAMMKSIAFLIAPLVLGITSALQDIVVGALGSLSESPGAETIAGALPGTQANIPIVSFGDPATLASIPDPITFLLIIALYVIEITVLLLYFTSKIEEGDNPLAIKMTIAKTLPISLVLFFFSAFFAAKMAIVT